MKKFLANPWVQGVGVVLVTLLVLSYVRPMVANVPVLNRI